MGNNTFKKYTFLSLFIIGLFIFTLQSSFADTTIQTGNATNSVTIQNKANQNILNIQCQCTPTPTSVAVVQVAATPTPGAQATATPTPVSSSSSPGGGSSSSSSPSGSSSPPQAVLGASTMAPTGTFAENVMDVLSAIGFGFIGLGLLRLSISKPS